MIITKTKEEWDAFNKKHRLEVHIYTGYKIAKSIIIGDDVINPQYDNKQGYIHYIREKYA